MVDDGTYALACGFPGDTAVFRQGQQPFGLFGKGVGPAMEVERLAMGSGFGFTSKAGLRAHEPRFARNPWLRRWSSVLPSATEAITRLKSS